MLGDVLSDDQELSDQVKRCVPHQTQCNCQQHSLSAVMREEGVERSHTGCRKGVVSHCCEPPVSLNLQAGLAPRMFRELFDEIRHLQVIDSGHDALQLPGHAWRNSWLACVNP